MIRIVVSALGLSAVLVLSPQSQPPSKTEPAPVNAATLGRVEGMITFCSKVDPDSAEKYKKASDPLTKGQKEAVLVEARRSEEYKNASDAIAKQLKLFDEQAAVTVCRSSLKKDTDKKE